MASLSLINRVKYSRTLYSVYFYLGSALIRLLKLFLREDGSLIIFNSYGGQRFDDSPKVIYDLIIEDDRFKKYKLVWAFTNPEKYNISQGRIVKVDTLRYYITLLRARIWITNTAMNRGLDFTGINSFIFNTWHGTPIKMLGADMRESKNAFVPKSKNKLADILLAQGEYDKAIYSKCFNLPQENIRILGLPRNDELSNNNGKDRVANIKKKLGLPNKKIILYAPTFREYEKDGVNCVMSLPIDFEKWERILGEEYILLLRAHHEVVKVMNIKENAFIKNVSSYSDLNELMMVSDILISDYSSIFFDYSILGKPMFSFSYDYDKYNEERGLYFDIRKDLKCMNLNTEANMLDAIQQMDENERAQITKDFRNKYVQAFGEAGKKSIDIVYAVLNNTI